MNDLNFPRLLKLLSPIWIGLVLVLLCCGALVLGPILANANLLREYGGYLFDYPLPPQTRVVRRETKMWRGDGNGNGCFYEAQLVVASTLSQAELEAHYRPLVGHPDSELFDRALYQWVDSSIGPRSATRGEIQLTLRLQVQGPETTLDFRCH